MEVHHDPGQFVQVSVPGIGEVPISIASDSFKHINLNIKEVGNVTKALSRLKKNDAIFIRGPYGKGYPMKNVKGKDLVIFAALDKEAKPLKAVLRDLMPIDETLKGEFQSRNPAFRLFPKNIAVFIGPEGDFSPREISMAKENCCSMCSLGSLVLKSETAAIYMLSCLSYESQ